MIGMGVLGGFVGSANAFELSLNASQDTYFRVAAAETDFGAMSALTFRQNGSRAVLEYDLSGIREVITNGILKVHMSANIAGAYNVQVFPMTFTENNYSWQEGSGTVDTSSANADSIGSGAATYLNRYNGANDLAWEDASSNALGNAAADGLWGAELGRVTGTNWTPGTFLSISLDAAALEAYRAKYGKITIGMWDADLLGAADNYRLNSKDAHVSAYRPVLEVMARNAESVWPKSVGQNSDPNAPTGDLTDAANASLSDEARARQIVGKMTFDEKIDQLHGIHEQGDDGSGQRVLMQSRIVPGVPRLGIPALPLCNGPAGAGPGGPGHEGDATALSAPISLAATWSLDAARTYGEICATEAACLANVLLESPDVNIIRTPLGGRTFECFSEDPFLSSQIGVASIHGIQRCGVIANVKHFAVNNQEMDRQQLNAVIDERTLREIYLPAFEASVKEGKVGSVMAAYNKLNGTYCTENKFLLTDVLKKEWNFDGFITSDFNAVHSTILCVESGLDLELPTGKYWSDQLKKAVEDGQVSIASLDEKLIRRYRTMMQFSACNKEPVYSEIPAEAHAKIAMKIGAEGVVLLKNDDHQLPLSVDKTRSVALIGPFAQNAKTGGGGSSLVSPLRTTTPEEGIRKIVGPDVPIEVVDGKDLKAAVDAAKSADVVILMLGDHQSEGQDHPIALQGNQDTLAQAVLKANRNAIIVLKTGGPILMPWIDLAPTVLEAWYPGQEDGDVVASVLFGEVNPSGKLPVTFPKREEDLPLQSPEQYPGIDKVVHYSEGVLVGYRWFDAKNIEPLFPFGHGLSYTTFDYKDLTVSTPEADDSVIVSFTVTNTGKRDGAEVAQIYVGLPSLPGVLQPPRQLKGFRRVELAAGQSARVTVELDVRSRSYWDVKKHGWQVASGTYTVAAAASSRDIRLSGTFNIK